MENITHKAQRLTLTDLMRQLFKGILDPLGEFFNHLGIMPNTMTILGLIGNILGAVLVSQGHLTLGGILVLIMGPVDALDGTMARLRGMAGQFGAFVDSVTDRYSELVILGGLIYYYSSQANQLGVLLAYLAAAGSVLVSYIRSRGQSLGWDTKVGILTRMERYLIIAPSLIFQIPMVGLWIIAIFANITALQRIVDVRRQAHHSQQNHTQKSA